MLSAIQYSTTQYFSHLKIEYAYIPLTSLGIQSWRHRRCWCHRWRFDSCLVTFCHWTFPRHWHKTSMIIRDEVQNFYQHKFFLYEAQQLGINSNYIFLTDGPAKITTQHFWSKINFTDNFHRIIKSQVLWSLTISFQEGLTHRGNLT